MQYNSNRTAQYNSKCTAIYNSNCVFLLKLLHATLLDDTGPVTASYFYGKFVS